MTHFLDKAPRRPGLAPGPRFFFCGARRSGTPAQGRGDEGRGGTGIRLFATAALLALTACGKAAGLAPPPGGQLPIAPRGAKATPTPADLLTATPQQRPQRGDELLRSSQERRSDDFDLPPPD